MKNGKRITYRCGNGCSKDKLIELSDEDFKTFEKEVEIWQNYFNLNDFAINCVFAEMEPEVAGEIMADTDNRFAEIYLNKRMSHPNFSTKEIRLIAFHEVCELFLYRIRELAEKRDFSWNIFDSEIHRVIRTLENTVFEDLDNI